MTPLLVICESSLRPLRTLRARPCGSTSSAKGEQCRPLTAAAPRYRRMETKGDGRSGALVKLTPSPRALFFSAHESANGTEELCQAPLANVC